MQGFVFPRTADVNPDADIEWELGFHRAETFIMRSLHYPKLRVYLFSVLLYKAYFEAFEVQNKSQIFFKIYAEICYCALKIFFSLSKHTFIKYTKASGTYAQYPGKALFDLKMKRLVFTTLHLKGLSHEIDFKNFNQALKNLTEPRAAAGF